MARNSKTVKPVARLVKSTRGGVGPIAPVWETVTSDTIEAFAYVAPYRDLLVRFKSGGSYVYREVEPALVARLRRAHPWHEIGKELRDESKHPYERLATIRTQPLKGRKTKAAK